MRISSGEAKDVNEDSLIKNAVIYAIIFFAAIEALACLLIFFSYIKRTFLHASEAETATDAIEENAEDKSEEKSED